MHVEDVLISKLKPYHNNPRICDNTAIEAVARSIQEFGFNQPIIVDREYIIIAGHTRFEAAKRLGLTSVPVYRIEKLTPAQVKAYRLADNHTRDFTSWNYELLIQELVDLEELSFPLENTTFSAIDIERFKDLSTSVFSENIDRERIWQAASMPEYQSTNKAGYHSVHLHFLTKESLDEFNSKFSQEIFGQQINEKTRYLWYPRKERRNMINKKVIAKIL